MACVYMYSVAPYDSIIYNTGAKLTKFPGPRAIPLARKADPCSTRVCLLEEHKGERIVRTKTPLVRANAYHESAAGHVCQRSRQHAEHATPTFSDPLIPSLYGSRQATSTSYLGLMPRTKRVQYSYNSSIRETVPKTLPINDRGGIALFIIDARVLCMASAPQAITSIPCAAGLCTLTGDVLLCYTTRFRMILPQATQLASGASDTINTAVVW